MRAFSPLLILLLSGCSCSPDADGSSCTNSTECITGQVCVDEMCQADGDAGSADTEGRGDIASVDTGPTADTGSGEDTGGPDARCGGGNIPFEYNPPNVLLILDRSCSMRRPIDAGDFGTGPEDPITRWNIARTAVLDMLGRFGSRAFWGMMAFPDPREGCGDPVDTEVAPGPATAMAIEAALRSDQIQPFGLCGLDNSDEVTQPRQTPTADALMSAQGVPEFSDPTRASFAIVVTDGGVSCGQDELETITTDLRNAGVPVGVIGFNTGTDVPSLDTIAQAGGLANPAGPPFFYTADDAASLDAVLDGIAERVVSCEFPLGMAPPDPSMLFVNVNDVAETMDPTNGWSYEEGSNTLTFNGALCDRLRSGEITRLRVSFGCPPSVCEPQPETCNSLDDDCDDLVDEDCLL